MSSIPVYRKIKGIKEKAMEKFLKEKGAKEVDVEWRKKLEKSKKIYEKSTKV